MCGLKTPLLALLALLTAGPAAADEAGLRLFATCTGRLSAQMEHQWLTGDPASDTTRALRDGVAQLVEAAMPAGAEAQVMDWRLKAKVAQAALMQRATFGPDPRAALRAEALLSDCRALLLG